MIDPKTEGLTSVAFHAKTIFAFCPLFLAASVCFLGVRFADLKRLVVYREPHLVFTSQVKNFTCQHRAVSFPTSTSFTTLPY